MPREIKFRAWHKKNKCFIKSHNLVDKNNVPVKSHGDHFSLDDQNVIYLQYTGLKDKNGVEIWEGDVVRIPTGYKFLVSMAHFSLGYEGSGAYGYAYYKHGEVLGNLYENQELLGDKDAN